MLRHEYASYADYLRSQREANRRKADKSWVREANVKRICEWLMPYAPRTGICHGTRQGWEQHLFMRHLRDCVVVGTELGEATAANTIQHDFNLVLPEWDAAADFLYSNSWDHAYDPPLTFCVWAGQLKPGGHMILETSEQHEHAGRMSKRVNKTDPFGATPQELRRVIPKWTPLRFVEQLTMPVGRGAYGYAMIYRYDV